MGNLTSSVSYVVQVKCVTSRQCWQCPWSDALTVPPELTSTPVIEVFDVIPPRNGKRLIIARWKIANNESVAGYRVTVAKVSGELTETLITSQPAVWLSLSGSAYHINISAFNSASTSPPAQRRVPMVQNTNEIDVEGNLSVTFKDNSSFHISWNSSLNRAYSCFSVEWGMKEGQELFFDPFHQKNSKKTVKAPLEPYKRYVFLLNARPDKDTCDLKRINNSESTIGRAEAYAKQGTPTSAPGNITCPEVSSTSLVIAWSAVPEAETRGFLQGYIIYQKENGKGQNLSVGADVNRVTLSNLKSQTVYEVQLSAFTAAGEGVRSDSFYFETKGRDYSIIGGAVGGIVGGIVIPLLVARLCSRLFQRAKKLFWPSIPNPGNSNAIQKIDGDFEPEVLEPLSRERLAQIEESHTSSLLIIEGAAEISRPSIQYGEEEASPAGHKTEEDCPSLGEEMEPTPDAMETSENRPALPPVVSDYTTMELFQQTMSQPASTAQAEPQSNGMRADQPKTDQTDPLLVKPEQDYIRQALCHTLFQSHPNAADELNDMVHFSVY
ncbi:hypothetical protein AGOR_G00014760 [Albula goreensis]|uniref:Fibronectin type-III domain-containing protein n=1 Tax=Albula goreensis TaxID=1534307 RepID=A0A8T3ECC9_9TELE|nr:hypothetical protein AGOR_G00014760 [Albula goreensis]